MNNVFFSVVYMKLQLLPSFLCCHEINIWSLNVPDVPDKRQRKVRHLSVEDLVKPLILGHSEVILPVTDDA